MEISSNHNIEARKPDIVLLKIKDNECLIVDIAVPGDVKVEEKENEKSEKYKDLCRELKKLWNVDCKIIPIVVGALGTLPKRLTSYISFLGINLSVETIQKT